MAFSLSRPGGRYHPFRLAVTIGATGSPVPCQRLRRAHATSTPDTARTATRQPPDPQRPNQKARLHPGNYLLPRFRCHRSPFRCVNSGSLTFVFFVAHLTPHSGPFPQRSRPRLLTAAACGGLGSPPDRRSRRANLHHRHSTVHDNDLLHRHHSPFRTHQMFGVYPRCTRPVAGRRSSTSNLQREPSPVSKSENQHASVRRLSPFSVLSVSSVTLFNAPRSARLLQDSCSVVLMICLT